MAAWTLRSGSGGGGTFVFFVSGLWKTGFTRFWLLPSNHIHGFPRGLVSHELLLLLATQFIQMSNQLYQLALTQPPRAERGMRCKCKSHDEEALTECSPLSPVLLLHFFRGKKPFVIRCCGYKRGRTCASKSKQGQERSPWADLFRFCLQNSIKLSPETLWHSSGRNNNTSVKCSQGDC